MVESVSPDLSSVDYHAAINAAREITVAAAQSSEANTDRLPQLFDHLVLRISDHLLEARRRENSHRRS